MQKKLLTIAVAGAFAVPVAALADVTVYGSIDTGLKQQGKVFSGGTTGSKLSVDSQIKKSNRWGLKGSDDLGGGLMASFTLEGAYTSDATGDNLDGFNRKSIVGLSKGGNSVDIGRNYTLNFSTQGIWDPMGHDYGTSATYESVGTQGVRYDNSITGNFRFGTGGIGVQYAPGEVVGQGGWGTATAFAGDFAFGPVTVGAAFATKKDATGGSADLKTTGIGAAYKMGAFTFRGGYATEELEGTGKDKKIAFGVQYAMSPTLDGRVGYYNFKEEDSGGTEIGTGKVFVVTLEYSLSKSTLVYLALDKKTLDLNQNSSAAVAGVNTTTLIGVADGATGVGAGLVMVF